METLSFTIKGIYRDIIRDKNKKVTYDSGWVENTILNRCRILIAGFMKNSPNIQGIQYLAVGQGSAAWDTAGIPPVDASETGDLYNRFEPVIPVSDPHLILTYLQGENETTEPTSRLQITATLGEGYPPPIPPLTTYPLREFGLFGDFDGNKPFMINCIRHPVIHKDESATLIRVMRLYF